MNQEKSALGPSEWLPPVPELRCAYVEDFVGVLDAYDLGINAGDKARRAGRAGGLLTHSSPSSRQRQRTAIPAFSRVRMPIDQKIAGGTEPVFRWRPAPMPRSAPMIEEDQRA